MTSTSEWEWFGQPGHFIAADRCRWHLHTHVKGSKMYCVSSVGEYVPAGRDAKEPLYGRGPRELPTFYETMVFEIGDDGEPVNYEGLASYGYAGYNARDAARDGHLRACEKWEKR